ncbi:MAG: hypothetical protein WBA77_06800, partial [Microcoleaceae cyanobacterium]
TIPASDLYSLGATLIYLITRSHPADLPTRRGRIQFEVSSQISKRFQAWIKCLIQPDLEQRFSTAEKALKTLQNDDLPLDGFFKIKPKPENTKITLKKTDKKLQITIPYLFKSFLICISKKNITYIVTFFGMMIQRKVLPTKDIVKVERSWYLISILFKSDNFLIEHLTIIEAEWLFQELIDWLDLSIQETDRTAQQSKIDESNEKLTPENTSKDPNNNLVNSSNSLRNKKPSKTKCTIDKKSDNILIITAPGKVRHGDYGWAFILVFSVIFIVIATIGKIPLFFSFIIAVVGCCGIAAVGYFGITAESVSENIILEIDKIRNIAIVYAIDQPGQRKEYLSQIFFFLESIRDVQVVYYSVFYSVELRTRYHEQLLVGNRKLWLSKQEAYWLADELSQWLKVPVTEKKMIKYS